MDQDRPEADAAVYDIMHAAKGGIAGAGSSIYSAMFAQVVRDSKRLNMKSVLEVGCGSGELASLLLGETGTGYRGFDFSPVAVKNAIRRTGRPASFRVDDATNPAAYAHAFDGIVCTEVLEHIKQDLDVVRLWPSGTKCVCSVPNFDDPTHVRIFASEAEIRRRYGDLIQIDRLVRIPAPLIVGRGFRSWFRQLRWARTNLKRFLGLLGVNRFDWYAGWYVFSGVRT